MMTNLCKKLISVSILCFSIFPLLSFSQTKTLTCGDIKNGIFIFYSSVDGSLSTYTRNGEVQKEVNPRTHQTVLWDVEWLSDCSYSLKYNSGYDDLPKKQMDILNKHKVVVEILSVTDNYYVYKSSMDKATNPTLLTDTLWIKQRRDAKNKTVNNTSIDSITALKKVAYDSAISKSAVIYIYRPGKFFDNARNYDLYMDDARLCEMGNKSSYIVRVFKEGKANFHANVQGHEASVTTDIQYGKKYYLRCEIKWGLTSTPILTMSNAEEAKPYFDNMK
jgi:hypothetical protein